MRRRSLRTLSALLTISSALAACSALSGQNVQPAREIPDSRVDIYGGYGYLHPINSGVGGYQYQDISNPNATVSVAGFFNRYVGLQIEGGYFSSDAINLPVPGCPTPTCFTHNQKIYTAEAGPIVRWPLGRFVPFLHTLGGGERTNGPVYQPLTWGWGVTGGGGVDIVLPFFHNLFALRPIQADFQYSQVVYGPLHVPDRTDGGFGEIDALKLSGGLVARFGEIAEQRGAMLGCTVEPMRVFPGDPVQVTGSTLYLNPKHRSIFTWSTNGGKIKSAGPNATVDTTGMAPGDYTVLGHVDNGVRAAHQASCDVPFTIKPYEPPTITCSASPATVASGTQVDINTVGTSPQNRPLTYSYSASEGTVNGNGRTASLNTDGLSPSGVTVTCNVVDDVGHTATTTTQVTIEKPVVPVIPQTQELCTIGFTRDKKRPVRVDNEAKGCLDDIALTLNRQTDARLVVVGNAVPEDKPDAAAERALNVRQYLTREKGIDPSRVDVRTGNAASRTAQDILVPSGATFSQPESRAFDEQTIIRHGQAYGKPRHTAPAAGTSRPGSSTPQPPRHQRRRSTSSSPAGEPQGSVPAQPQPGN